MLYSLFGFMVGAVVIGVIWFERNRRALQRLRSAPPAPPVCGLHKRIDAAEELKASEDYAALVKELVEEMVEVQQHLIAKFGQLGASIYVSLVCAEVSRIPLTPGITAHQAMMYGSGLALVSEKALIALSDKIDAAEVLPEKDEDARVAEDLRRRGMLN